MRDYEPRRSKFRPSENYNEKPGLDGIPDYIDGFFMAVAFLFISTMAVEDEGVLLIKNTTEYKSLVAKYGPDHVSVKAVNLHDQEETEFLSQISDGFRVQPGCIIVLKAGEADGYVYQLDEELTIVSRMTLSKFEQEARNVDARTMKHFYNSLN